MKKKQWKDFFFNLLFRDFLQQLSWAKRNWKPDGGFNAELKLDHGSAHGHYQIQNLPSFHVKYTHKLHILYPFRQKSIAQH